MTGGRRQFVSRLEERPRSKSARFGDGSDLERELRYAECGYEFRARIGEASIALDEQIPNY